MSQYLSTLGYIGIIKLCDAHMMMIKHQISRQFMSAKFQKLKLYDIEKKPEGRGSPPLDRHLAKFIDQDEAGCSL